MEEELRCPHCKGLFEDPVILPCFHSLCFSCAEELTGSSSSSTSSVSSDQEHLDKISISSQADSGVVADRPPGSITSNTTTTPSCQLPAAPPSVSSLSCPACRKLCLFDECGAKNLPRYRLVQSIIERRVNSLTDGPRCEMCDTEPRLAVVVCEQCAVHYCESCRELCHPSRGPLAKHTLVKPKLSAPMTAKASLCPDHTEQLQFFCGTCKVPACQLCINVNRHGTHDVQAISGVCKAQKVRVLCLLLKLYLFKSLSCSFPSPD